MLETIIGYKDFILSRPEIIPRVAKGVFDRLVLRKPHLRVVEIATTFRCNSKCVMCSCSKLYDPQKELNPLSVKEYESLGKQLDKLGCVSINVTGGEPLLRKDIKGIIRALNPRNKLVNLITNGINLTYEDMRDYHALGISSVVVSLESTVPQENDKIRGYEGHFQAVVQAIKWAKQEKIKFGISLTVGDFNFNKIYEMLEFADENEVFLCLAHGGSIGNWADNSAVRLSYENAVKILKLIKKHKRMKIDFSANLNLKPGCPGGIEKVFITPYGDVLPCTFNPISFGNFREEAFLDIWLKMRKFFEANIHGRTLCLRAYDADFIGKYLEPIKNMAHPVRIEEHPAVRNQEKI